MSLSNISSNTTPASLDVRSLHSLTRPEGLGRMSKYHQTELKQRNRRDYNPNKFKPDNKQIIWVSNDVKNYNDFILETNDDKTWPGINHTHKTSICKIIEFCIHNGQPMAMVKIIKSDNLTIGDIYPVNSDCLQAEYNKLDIIPLKPMPKRTFEDLNHIIKDKNAQLRADYFAMYVKKNKKHNEIVLLMDGLMRNAKACSDIDIPENDIVIIDRDSNTAWYHKMVSIWLQKPFKTYWTQEITGRKYDGIENCINSNYFQERNRISCMYLDFDCDIPKSITSEMLLNKLPKLKLCGITQTIRNRRNKFPILGRKLKEYKHNGIYCRFSLITDRSMQLSYEHKEIVHLSNDYHIPINKRSKRINKIVLRHTTEFASQRFVI